MATTSKITNVVKVAEFHDMADALNDAINNNSERRFLITDLLQKQTDAKQKKFWAFYDAHTKRCEDCGNLVLVGA